MVEDTCCYQRCDCFDFCQHCYRQVLTIMRLSASFLRKLSLLVIEMRRFAGLCVISLMLFAVDQTVAQESGLFSGKGLSQSSGWGLSGIGGPNSNALGGSNSSALGAGSSLRTLDDAAAAIPRFKFPELNLPKLKTPNWELPKLFKGNQFPDPIQISDSKQGLLSGLPKLDEIFPARDANRPGFFQRMNERTKEIFGRTQNNIDNLARSADETGRNTLDSITRGLNGDIGGSGNRNQPPIQPNLRSARQVDGSTSRY